MPPIITLAGVSKQFHRQTHRGPTTLKTYLLYDIWRHRKPSDDVIWAVRDVNLTIERGAAMAIVGRNGSGKTTLLNLIGGRLKPTTGMIWIGGKATALLELGIGFHPELTGRENILINGIILGLSRKEIRRLEDAIVRFAELEDFIDEPMRTYSTGMCMRLGFSVAVHADPDILLIDEVLAVGDLGFAQKCLDRMGQFKKERKTILLVTHDLALAQTWCDLAVWMHQGRVALAGEPAKVIDAYRHAVAG